MKTVQEVIVTIDRALKADPRPRCFACFGITSQDLCDEIEKHVHDKLNTVYTVEYGTCHRKDHHARVIHPRDSGKPLPKL